jgi:hypothetical protein
MTESIKPKFFQNEKKFVVGKSYETLRVQRPRFGTYEYNLETCDEIGTIIPNSEKFLGTYVSSQNYGYGDNGGRYDYFTNENNETITNCLDYDGKTRYREVQTCLDEKVNYLMLYEEKENEINKIDTTDTYQESTQIQCSDMPPPPPDEHINNYLFDLNVAKEIRSFMTPLI